MLMGAAYEVCTPRSRTRRYLFNADAMRILMVMLGEVKYKSQRKSYDK